MVTPMRKARSKSVDLRLTALAVRRAVHIESGAQLNFNAVAQIPREERLTVATLALVGLFHALALSSGRSIVPQPGRPRP